MLYRDFPAKLGYLPTLERGHSDIPRWYGSNDKAEGLKVVFLFPKGVTYLVPV